MLEGARFSMLCRCLHAHQSHCPLHCIPAYPSSRGSVYPLLPGFLPTCWNFLLKRMAPFTADPNAKADFV